MREPARIRDETGLYSLVDGIPFQLPVGSRNSPALMAAFCVDANAAAELLPGKELHPLRLPGGRSVLLVTVIDYTSTNIGKYIEFSVALAVTHGRRTPPPLLPLLFQKRYGVGQYVYDLPVSTEISVKGGKGIWGMPKHQANLDYQIGSRTVSSQYDLDGELAMRITIRRPLWTPIPLRMGAVNYCEFRGLLWKSSIYFQGRIGLSLMSRGAAELIIGDHPRVAALKKLDIHPRSLFTVYFPASGGVLDDHFEGWFLGYDDPPASPPEGMESVANLGLSQEWLPPPTAAGRRPLVEDVIHADR
jgi:Acetoacetate decarboxylase (ADC)